MPKRCLEISLTRASSTLSGVVDNDRLYLYSFDKLTKPHPYATLSYCWGDPGQQILTVNDNLPEFVDQGIPLSILPRSIRDAVTVTQRLGIRFLWVDALCIVQDDDGYKNLGISHMADIYRNADITISAASASNVADGFLEQRETWSGEGLAPIWLPWGAGGCIGLYHNLMPALRVHDPIHERAWTLQETLLSSRLLVYSKQHHNYACLCTTSNGLIVVYNG